MKCSKNICKVRNVHTVFSGLLLFLFSETDAFFVRLKKKKDKTQELLCCGHFKSYPLCSWVGWMGACLFPHKLMTTRWLISSYQAH